MAMIAYGGTLWSDGKYRSADFQGSDLYQALRAYYTARNEEVRLGLLWDNEYMRRQLALARERATQEQARLAATAAA